MVNWQEEVAEKLTERAEKAEEGWIKAERRLGNCCPLCGSDASRPGHLGCQCIKNIKAARKHRETLRTGHSVGQRRCGKYLGDNDGTCPQLTCIRDKDHDGGCDNARDDRDGASRDVRDGGLSSSRAGVLGEARQGAPDVPHGGVETPQGRLDVSTVHGVQPDAPGDLSAIRPSEAESDACERGTKGCIVEHGSDGCIIAAATRTNEAEAASCPTCGRRA